MTSTDDGKDLKSISTSPQKGKAYYIELYKNLETRLSSKSSCGQRVNALSDAWRRICELCQHSSQATQIHLLAWLQTHTAGVLLQAEWQSPESIEHHSILKNVLDTVIQQIDQDVTSRASEAQFWEVQLVLHAQRFKRMISEPWGHPVLRMLLNTQGDQPDDEQIVEWLSEEKGVMLVARLRQLATAKCQDLALGMITAIMDRVRDHKLNGDEEKESVVPYNTNCTEDTFVDRLIKNADFTQDVWESLTDMEFVLLHKLGKSNRCKLLVKHLCLRGVRRLIERLRGRLELAPNDKKLWKNAKDVAMLITGAVVHRCMTISSCSGVTAWALTYCTRALLLLSDGRPADYALYVKEAVTARHLHTFTVAVETVCKESESMRSFVCELYIHTLTYGMNELQPLKDKTDKESEARTMEKTLCTWFVQLGDFLRASERIHAECLLTAFSVHPSEEMYSKLVGAPDLPRIKIDESDAKGGEFKSVYGSWAHDSSTKTNFVKTSETLNLKQTTRQANVLSTALLSEGEGLGLGPELCSDLASLLGGPRVKTLSWDMDRDVLLENCRTYMERTGGGTKSLITELKYLNLDPSEVEHLPEEDEDENDIYYGIEKGYEHLVEFQDSPEAVWEDPHALLFPSTDEECNESACSTGSYYDYDIGSKKTHKKKIIYSDNDCDPLSLNAETKKKERSRSKDNVRNEDKREDRSRSKDKYTHKDKSTHKTKRKSKERSRERRKDRSLSKEKSSKKTDEKKRRHKKKDQFNTDNIDKIGTSSSLSGLIGMKVCSLSSDPSQTEIKKMCKKKERRRLEKEQKRKLKDIKKEITDSDYDSQGKSSLTSLATSGTMDSDVLLDGFFSMDEMCSPEKNSAPSSFTSQPTTMSLVNSHELSMTNGSLSIQNNVNSVQEKPLNVLSKSDSSKSLIRAQSTSSVDVHLTATTLTSMEEHKISEKQSTDLNMLAHKEQKPFMVHVNALTDTSKELKTSCTPTKTDVKSTVARLIEFRKQKNTNIGKTMTMNVKVLDPHNVYKNLNKTQGDLKPSSVLSSNNLSMIQTMKEVVNSSPVCMPVTADDRDDYAAYLSKLYPNLQLNTVEREPKKQTFAPRIISNSLTSIKNAPNTSIEQSVGQTNSTKRKSTKLANTIQKGAISTNKSQLVSFDKRSQLNSDVGQIVKVSGNMQNSSGNVVTQKSIQDFVKELQETINAGTCGTKKSSVPLQNMAPPVQCAKILQKKVDDAPNTFARLCYMHKNKQYDTSKLRQPVVNTPVPVISGTLNTEQFPADQKLSKLKTLQTRGHLTVSLLNNPKSPTKGSADLQHLQNTRTSDTASEVNPILSTLLSNSNTNTISSKQMHTKSSNINVHSPAYDIPIALTQTMNPSPHYRSALSISDQLELQRLLWQRNKLNANILQTIKTKPEIVEVAKSTAISHNIVQHPFYGLNTNSTESINNSLLIQNRPSAIVQNNSQKTVSHHASNTTQSKSAEGIRQNIQCDKKTKIVRQPRHISNSIQTSNNTVQVQEIKNKIVDSTTETDILQKNQTSIDHFRSECKLKSNSKDLKVYEVQQQDWESVLNELLSHQTPSRGENALDLKLRKDYIREKTKKKISNDDVTNQRIIKMNTNTRLLENKLTKTKNVQSAIYRSSKIPSALQTHTVCSSDIPHSSPVPGVDCPLLDEEIDKDLLQEIDELTSDEDSFPNSSSELNRSKQNDSLKESKLHNKEFANDIDKSVKYVAYSKMKKGTSYHSKELKKQGKFVLKMDCTKSAMTQPRSYQDLHKAIEVAPLSHNSKLSSTKRVQQHSDCDKVATKSLSKIMTGCRTVDSATVKVSSVIEKPRREDTIMHNENSSRKIDLSAKNDLKERAVKNDDSFILLQTTSANICLPIATAETQRQTACTNYNQIYNQYLLNPQFITQPKALHCSNMESKTSSDKSTKGALTSANEVLDKKQMSSALENQDRNISSVPPSCSNMFSFVTNVRNVPLNILVTPLIQNISGFHVTKASTSKEVELKSDNRSTLPHNCQENDHQLNINECRTTDDNKHIKHQTRNFEDVYGSKLKEPRTLDKYKYKELQSNVIQENIYQTQLKTLQEVDDCKPKKYQTDVEENIHQSQLIMSQTNDDFKLKKYQISSSQNIHQLKLKVPQSIYDYKPKEYHQTSIYKDINQKILKPPQAKDTNKHKEYQISSDKNIHESVLTTQPIDVSKLKKCEISSQGNIQQSKTKEFFKESKTTVNSVDYSEKEYQTSNSKNFHHSKVKAAQAVDNHKHMDYPASTNENIHLLKIKASHSSNESKHDECQKNNCENIYQSKINVHEAIDDYIRKKYQTSSFEYICQQKLKKALALDDNKYKECHTNFNTFHSKIRKYPIMNDKEPEEYQASHVDNVNKFNTKEVDNDKGKEMQNVRLENVSHSKIKKSHTVINSSDKKTPTSDFQSNHQSKIKESNPVDDSNDEKLSNVHIPKIKDPLITSSNIFEECKNSNDDIHQLKMKEFQVTDENKEKECQTSGNAEESKINQLVDNDIDMQFQIDVGNISQIEIKELKAKDIKDHKQSHIENFENKETMAIQMLPNHKEKNHENSPESTHQLQIKECQNIDNDNNNRYSTSRALCVILNKHEQNLNTNIKITTFLDTLIEKERLKMKRLSIMNREINRTLYYPPIPLKYDIIEKSNNMNLAKNTCSQKSSVSGNNNTKVTINLTAKLDNSEISCMPTTKNEKLSTSNHLLNDKTLSIYQELKTPPANKLTETSISSSEGHKNVLNDIPSIDKDPEIKDENVTIKCDNQPEVKCGILLRSSNKIFEKNIVKNAKKVMSKSAKRTAKVHIKMFRKKNKSSQSMIEKIESPTKNNEKRLKLRRTSTRIIKIKKDNLLNVNAHPFVHKGQKISITNKHQQSGVSAEGPVSCMPIEGDILTEVNDKSSETIARLNEENKYSTKINEKVPKQSNITDFEFIDIEEEIRCSKIPKTLCSSEPLITKTDSPCTKRKRRMKVKSVRVKSSGEEKIAKKNLPNSPNLNISENGRKKYYELSNTLDTSADILLCNSALSAANESTENHNHENHSGNISSKPEKDFNATNESSSTLSISKEILLCDNNCSNDKSKNKIQLHETDFNKNLNLNISDSRIDKIRIHNSNEINTSTETPSLKNSNAQQAAGRKKTDIKNTPSLSTPNKLNLNKNLKHKIQSSSNFFYKVSNFNDIKDKKHRHHERQSDCKKIQKMDITANTNTVKTVRKKHSHETNSIEIIKSTSNSSRIVLSNGRAFKATVIGNTNFNVDELLSNPNLRRKISDQIRENKKYTLNIKSVPKIRTRRGSKYMEATVKSVDDNIPRVPVVKNVETVNLISDDEDEKETYDSYATEFGSYKVPPVEKSVLLMHQHKFNQKSLVCLERIHYPSPSFSLMTKAKVMESNEKTVNPNISFLDLTLSSDDEEKIYIDNKKSNSRLINKFTRNDKQEEIISESNNVEVISNCDERISLFENYNSSSTTCDQAVNGTVVNNCKGLNLQTVETVEKVFDSSGKDISLAVQENASTTSREQLRNVHKSDFLNNVHESREALTAQKITKNSSSDNMPDENLISLNWPNENIFKRNIQSESETKSKLDAHSPVQDKCCNYNELYIKPCSVKILKCDKILQKIQDTNKRKCYVKLEKYDHLLEQNQNTAINADGSVKSTIKNTDKIFQQPAVFDDEDISFNTVHYKQNIFRNEVTTNNSFVARHTSLCTSPVMEMFEIIAQYNCKINHEENYNPVIAVNSKVDLKFENSCQIQCKAEWFLTKSKANLLLKSFLSNHICEKSNTLAPVFYGVEKTKILTSENDQKISVNMNISNQITVKENYSKSVNDNDDLSTVQEINTFSAQWDTDNHSCCTIDSFQNGIDDFSRTINVDNGICDRSSPNKLLKRNSTPEETSEVENKTQSTDIQTHVPSLLSIIVKSLNDKNLIEKITSLDGSNVLKSNLHNKSLKRKRNDDEIDTRTNKVSKVSLTSKSAITDCALYCEENTLLLADDGNLETKNDSYVSIKSAIRNEIYNNDLGIPKFHEDKSIKLITSKSIEYCIQVDNNKYSEHQDIESVRNALSSDVSEIERLSKNCGKEFDVTESPIKKRVDGTKSADNTLIISDNIKENDNEIKRSLNDTKSADNTLIISDNIKENDNEIKRSLNNVNYNNDVENKLIERESLQNLPLDYGYNDNLQYDTDVEVDKLDQNKAASDGKVQISPDIIKSILIKTEPHNLSYIDGKNDLQLKDIYAREILDSSTSSDIIKMSRYEFCANSEEISQEESEIILETNIKEETNINSNNLVSPFNIAVIPNEIKFYRPESKTNYSYLKYSDHEYVSKLSKSTVLSETIVSKDDQHDSNNGDLQDDDEIIETDSVETTYSNADEYNKSNEDVYSCYDVITIQLNDDSEDEIISTFLECGTDSVNMQHIVANLGETTLPIEADNSNMGYECTEEVLEQSDLTFSDSYNCPRNNSDTKIESDDLTLPNPVSPKALFDTNVNRLLLQNEYCTHADQKEDNNYRKTNVLNIDNGCKVELKSEVLLDTFDSTPKFINKDVESENAQFCEKNLEETVKCMNHERLKRNSLQQEMSSPNEDVSEDVKSEDENTKDAVSLRSEYSHIDIVTSKNAPMKQLKEDQVDTVNIVYENLLENAYANQNCKEGVQNTRKMCMERLENVFENNDNPFDSKVISGSEANVITFENTKENLVTEKDIERYESIDEIPKCNNLDSIVTGYNVPINCASSDDLLSFIPPNKTYSISRLKRKNETRPIGISFKKCRKGKNIDIPKISKSSIQATSYKKQFDGLSNYSNSLKFSYYQFFGKGYCEIEDLKIENWPLTSSWNSNYASYTQNENGGSLLFTEYEKDEQDSIPAISLSDEMSVDQLEKDIPLFESTEHVMNMGFGEESGRVILNTTSIVNTSKWSAATLSDVKRSQPCPPSEDCEINKNITNVRPNMDKHVIDDDKFVNLRIAVRKFFENIDINENFFNSNRVATKQLNSSKLCKMLTNVPGLYGTEFIRPYVTEQTVQVVQVGQLPVSAAAQNPVSCDSRVSQATDASPSQCSVENSPHSGINDNAQTNIAKTNEYTELTTADLSMPLVQDIDNAEQTMGVTVSQNSNMQPLQNVHIDINDKTEENETVEQNSQNRPNENNVSPTIDAAQTVQTNNVDYRYDNTSVLTSEPSVQLVFNTSTQHNISESFIHQKQENGSIEKNDQIANAMNAAGIATTNTRAHALVNILSQKIIRPATASTAQTATNSYSKTTSINAMAIQQALAQILPPPLNQTSNTENAQPTPQVLHIVQGKNATGNQITLLDNSQQSVISSSNATQVLHIVQNKTATSGTTSNGAQSAPPNSFSGISLVDASLPPGGSQLLHIVNTGNNQKNNNTGQLLKRVNLLTNIANVQDGNEQKMVQFVCKSADGKAIQLNAPHQRSMVLRLQPIERPPVQTVTPKQVDTQAESPTNPIANSLPPKDTVTTQEIKSRSVYEENYAKFIQNSSTKQSVVLSEKSTSLPKFNQAFGKPVFQDGVALPKQNEISGNNPHIPVVNNTSEATDCTESAINLDHIGQISSPPLLLRKSPAQTSQPQPNIVQQIKQTISPMNIQTMHGGVIYTRQIPVNIGGGQTINLITVPSTELIDESTQKQSSDVKFVSQGEIEQSIIKIVPQSQTSNEESASEDNGQHSNVNNDGSASQPQPVLTQMRIKLPMLSKTPQVVPGARMVRPSLFQIQRNVIGGANQPVYQQLVLTAAPPLGQQTIRLPQSQVTRQIKIPADNQIESQLSSSTLEQLREFDMVLEQVKERSTVHPGGGINTFTKLHTSPSGDTTDSSSASATAVTPEHPQQVLYSIGGAQALNVTYVTRKPAITTPTTVAYVRSPDSSGIADSPSPQIAQNVPDSPVEMQHKPTKINSKSAKSRPSKPSSTPPNSMKVAPVPPKTSAQKPLEDEQTTQRILYILAEYKEQVENSPDKDKPAPRRRSNPPSNPSGSSKRKKSSSGSRRPGGNGRDSSPVTSEDPGRTMGSEDSSCGTSQGDCNENCGADTLSPQDSPRKVARKLPFEQESAPVTPTSQTRPQPQRNVIVADGQTIAVARGATGKPATAVLMPANYILPVSMVKGGQQIAIVTNRGPKLLTVGATGAGAESGAANALLLQRLIGPAGLKPVLTRPGVRHVRLPTAALHNLQTFNLTAAAPSQPTHANEPAASPAPAAVPTPPEPQDTVQPTDPWPERDRQVDAKSASEASPEGADAWRLPSAPDPRDYAYDESTHRTDNMDRPVLDSLSDRYSPDMEAQRIFDKMFDVSDAKKSYIVEAHDAVSPPRVGHAYGIDAAHDCHDKGYPQVVNKKDASGHPGGGEVSGGTLARAGHASAAALRHKYAMLEHELRLQKSLSEECEDLGVDSPSASELFPEADLLFAASPAHDHGHDNTHTSQSTLLNQSGVPQPDLEDHIATDHLLPEAGPHGAKPHLVECSPNNDLENGLNLGDVGVVTVSALNHEEFARSHPNTTFHSEPTDDAEVQPFTMSSLKGRHITSTIFHASTSGPTTVLMTAAAASAPLKYTDIDNVIDSMAGAELGAGPHSLTRFDNMLGDTRELHLGSGGASHVAPASAAAHVIRRVCYDNDKSAAGRYLLDEPDTLIAGDDAKISVVEDSSRDATLESIADDDRSSPERHAELFWESNSASERSESRRPLDFSSDSDKCCKSPSLDETNSTDSSGLGARLRLDTVIKEARGRRRSGSADGSSADDATHPPVRTYPAKRPPPSLTGKTRAGDPPHQAQHTVRRRASGRGVVKRGCHCCNGSPAPPHHASVGTVPAGAGPPRPKKPRTRRPPATAAAIGNVPPEH